MAVNNDEVNPDFEILLEFLKASRGFDFSGYKRASLVRRVNRRLQVVGISDYARYVEYLEVHPDEFYHLFNTILINVTGFFRDREAWDHIMADVVPRILASKAPGDPIRVWSAGCSSGEEAYTAAMAFAELMGIDEVRDRVKIYATDVDEEALTQARHGAYLLKEMGGVPPRMMGKYFERIDNRYSVRKDLRRAIIFGRNDLLQDAPISRIDLLICRNTLMYFTAETQTRILSRFHFALADAGFLFLGRAEMLLSRNKLFAPVDSRRRTFSKEVAPNSREHLWTSGSLTNGERYLGGGGNNRLKDLAFDVAPTAQIVVDSSGVLVAANDQARSLFALAPRDIGRPIQELEISYRPQEIRYCIEQAYSQRTTVMFWDVEWKPGPSERRWLNVQGTPLSEPNGPPAGVGLAFSDETRFKRMHDDLQQSNRELETAYEELQSTNEELETTNEELQSTVEELETTNEELQSTTEEMETMNEELQSTNEELQSINNELRLNSEQLNMANSFWEAILSSLRGGVAVLDHEQRILIWSPHAQELWGLRADEVLGRHFLNLDIGLPVGRLHQAIRECMSGDTISCDMSVPATNRRGAPIVCHVSITTLNWGAGRAHGVILLMYAEPPDGAAALDGRGSAARLSLEPVEAVAVDG